MFRRKVSPTAVIVLDPTEPVFEQYELREQRRRALDALQAIDLGLFIGWDDDRIVATAKDRLRPRTIVLP